MNEILAGCLLVLVAAFVWWQFENWWWIVTRPFALVRSILWWRKDRRERRADAALAAMQVEEQKVKAS